MGVNIPAGFGQAALIFTAAGRAKPMFTTIGYSATDAEGTPSDRAELVRQAWSSAGGIFTAANLHTGYAFRGVQVTETVAGEHVVGQSMFTVIGGFGSASIPSNCALLVKKNTARGGRRGRGRMYLPPCVFAAEDLVDMVGNITEAARAAIESGCVAARDKMVTNGVPPFLLHEENMVNPDAILSFSVAGQIATQRRRIR